MNFLFFLFVLTFANGYINSNWRTKLDDHKLSNLHNIKVNDRTIGTKPGRFKPEIKPYVTGSNVVTPPHKYPFLVAVYIYQVRFCGGVLISDLWVLTSGNCTASVYNSIIAEMGAHNISENEETQVADETYEFITHEDYNSQTLINDIGLIKLPAPAIYTDAIRIIALPKASDVDLGEEVPLNITGWGYDGGISDVPYEATVYTISKTECASYYGEALIAEGSICTSGENGLGVCTEDSGGPVIYETANGLELRGIISYGGCGNGIPSVHTRITHYLDWIKSKTGIV